MKLTRILINLSIPAFAQAGSLQPLPYDICLYEGTHVLSETTNEVLPCVDEKVPKIDQTSWYYPKIDSQPLRVNYWKAHIAKNMNTTQNYLYEVIDVCNGKVTYSRTYSETKKFQIVYHLKNPNLDSSITESFKTAAMATKEAHDKFAELKQKCNTPGDRNE